MSNSKVSLNNAKHCRSKFRRYGTISWPPNSCVTVSICATSPSPIIIMMIMIINMNILCIYLLFPRFPIHICKSCHSSSVHFFTIPFLSFINGVEFKAQAEQLEANCRDLQRQLGLAQDRSADQREEIQAIRAYADRLANELIKLKQFKALERASMPDPDENGEDEHDGSWVPSPKKGDQRRR